MAEVAGLAQAAVGFRRDVIVSLGGGSAIDTGKWVALVAGAIDGDPVRMTEMLGP
jgi:alcohol dehydrogenase class IV